LIVALVAAVTLTLFMAAAGAQQLAAPQPAAEQDGDPAVAFFDRIEAEEAAEEGEAAEATEEATEEAKEKAEEAREEAAEAAEEKAEEAAEEGD
jgi:colicin import membrane protein